MHVVPTFAFAASCALAAAAIAQEPATPPIPAPADGAQAALTGSPRHGEWIDIPMPAGPAVRAFVVYPERADDAPVVIVIHEIFGLTDWVRGVADGLAAEGYVAIAPDLLSGKGPNGGGTESFTGDDVRRAVRELPADEVNARLDAVRAHALGLPGAGDRSATIGFCWGGSRSFGYAAHQPELGAAVVYYGTGPSDAAAVTPIRAPVLGIYGGDDARVTSTVEATTALMAQHDKPFKPVVYDRAGHGFLRQQFGQDGANLRAAQQAWSETLAFLREHLEP